MKNLLILFSFLAAFAFACNSSAPKQSAEEKALQEEIQKLDSLSIDLEETSNEIEENKKALEEAVKELEDL